MEIEKIGAKHYRVNGEDVFVSDKDDSIEAVRALLNAPATEPAKLKRRIGEFREFMELFTDEEQLAIIAASMQSPQIKLWYDKAMGGPSFSLDNPQTPYGLGALVAAGLLTQERVDEILDADFDAVVA